MKKYLLSELTSGSDYNLMKASLLQKLIRRGMTREALYIGTIFLKQGHEKGLRRRLQIIAAEDIGLGWPESLNYIEKNEDLLKIIQALCEAPKNRESDRFLLVVANDVNSTKGRGKSIEYEVRVLERLFELSSMWFNNPRDKVALANLRNAFSKMAENNSLGETIKILGENYIHLTKQKVHGARCQMALAALIYCRKWKPTKFIPSDKLEEPKEFDEIFDFAIDMHTPIGKKLKRDFNHWIKNCVQVIPEIKYRDLLDDIGKEKYPLTYKSNK